MSKCAVLAMLALLGCASAPRPCPRPTSSYTPVPRLTLEEGAPRGSLSRESIRQTIGGSIHRVRRCYDAALDADRCTSGRLVASFIISPDGSVAQTRIVDDDIRSPALAQCVDDAVRAMRFSPPDGGSVVVNYPFTLSTDAR